LGEPTTNYQPCKLKIQFSKTGISHKVLSDVRRLSVATVIGNPYPQRFEQKAFTTLQHTIKLNEIKETVYV
jgi:hypothetical protein